MTDKEKLEKIRSEVIWYIHLRNEGLIIGSCGDFEKLLKFIDSMQEEPVSNPIDFEQELYKAFGQVKDFTLCMRIAKRFYDMGKKSREPVCEELEEEIIRYIGYPQEVDEDISTTMIRKAARHFANWQKEEMTTNAIDGKVLANGMGNPILHLWDKGKYLIDKKVKVIVIKED